MLLPWLYIVVNVAWNVQLDYQAAPAVVCVVFFFLFFAHVTFPFSSSVSSNVQGAIFCLNQMILDDLPFW